MGRLGSRVAVLAQEVILADHPCVLPHHDPFPCPRAPHLDPALHPPCRAGDMRPCTSPSSQCSGVFYGASVQWHWKQARVALFGPGMQKIPVQKATGRRYDIKVVVGLVEAALDNFNVVERADFDVPKLDSTPQQGSKAPGKLPTDAWGVHGAPKVGHLACRAAPNSTPRLFGASLLGPLSLPG